jgi:cytochrome c556
MIYWKSVSGCIAALLMVAPALSFAQNATERAIRTRQSAYFLMGQQLGQINAVIKGDLPFDQPVLKRKAQLLDSLGHLVQENYPKGSDRGSTKAKPEIWKELPRFKQLASDSHEETAKLSMAVESGNLDTIKAAYGATSKSCKACHDVFKAK